MQSASILADVDDAITAALLRINGEISGYPGPISGCDAQFNHLLDCRRRLQKARAALARSEFIPTPRQPA